MIAIIDFFFPFPLAWNPLSPQFWELFLRWLLHMIIFIFSCPSLSFLFFFYSCLLIQECVWWSICLLHFEPKTLRKREKLSKLPWKKPARVRHQSPQTVKNPHSDIRTSPSPSASAEHCSWHFLSSNFSTWDRAWLFIKLCGPFYCFI